VAKKTKDVQAKASPKSAVRVSTRRAEQTVPVPVFYEKGALFRVIHADGVIGKILPSGRAMNVSLYSERFPFPKSEIYDIGHDGKMIEPREGAGEGKQGFYREIQISAVMDWQTAKSLSDWLLQAWPVLKHIAEKGNTNVGSDSSSSHNATTSGSKTSGTEGEIHRSGRPSNTSVRRGRGRK
jgi:hypothetical protein